MKILLDTTYILPVLGVHVKDIEQAMNTLSKLYSEGSISIYYSRFSLFEAIGKISRLKYSRDIVMIGIEAILNRFKNIEPSVRAFMMALELRAKGHRDLIDLILYSTAVEHGLVFLTRDEELKRFLASAGEENTGSLLLEDEFIRRYREAL